MGTKPLGGLSGIDALIQQQERLRDTFDPPALRQIRETVKMLQQPSAALKATTDAMKVAREVETIISSAARMQDVIASPALRQIFENMKAVKEHSAVFAAARDIGASKLQQSLEITVASARSDLVESPVLRQIRASIGAAQGYSAAIEATRHITDLNEFLRTAHLVTSHSSLLETIFRQSDFDRTADRIRVAAAGIPKLVHAFGKSNLQPPAELLGNASQFAEAPLEESPYQIVAEVPSEVFRALDLDLALTGKHDDSAENERTALSLAVADEVETLLYELDPELVPLLSGARSAAVSTNADRVRHTCVSLRELLRLVLDRIAPDEKILRWSQDPSLRQRGKPTQYARMRYLCEGIQETALRKFVDADIRIALYLFDLLGDGTHVPPIALTDVGFSILLSRAEGVLLMLLNVARVRES